MTKEEYANLRIGDRVTSDSRDYNLDTKKYDGPLVIWTVVGFNGKPVASYPGTFTIEVKQKWTLIAKANYDNERLSTARTLAES